MAEVLVIAYGNPLRADDGVGHHVAARLASAAGVRVVTGHQLMPEMAEDVSRAALVVFVDAEEGPSPGTVRERAVAAAAADRILTHHVTPETLLACAADWYGRAPAGVLMTVAGGDFSYGEALSPPVARAADAVVDRIEEIVSACMNSR